MLDTVPSYVLNMSQVNDIERPGGYERAIKDKESAREDIEVRTDAGEQHLHCSHGLPIPWPCKVNWMSCCSGDNLNLDLCISF